jgi:hypothetical protein
MADGSTPTRLMGQRDDGMKRSMGRDYGGCTWPCLQRWGISTVVPEGKCFWSNSILLLNCQCAMTLHKIANVTLTLHQIGDVTLTSHQIADVDVTLPI